MIDAKRVNLPNAGDGKPLHHPGLALLRYLKAHNDEPQDGKKDEKKSVKSLFEAVEKSAASEAYKTAFDRWEKTMREAGVVAFSMELGGPLAVGLGNASPMEIGLTTHHTYGMPTIPGSALKGMCARAAREFKKAGTIDCKQIEAMFGDTNSAAYLTFWDAWYDPGSVNGLPFHRDVITVHHPDYYSSGGKKEGKECWPTDFDDPVPIPFLAVRPGARFFFALSVPEEWRDRNDPEKYGKDFVSKMLQYALCVLGVGGKTNAGYGYFKKPAWLLEEEKAAREKAQAIAEEEARVAAIQAKMAEEMKLAILWPNVSVTKESGSSTLSAVYDSSKAFSRDSAAKEIMQSLPSEYQDRLSSKKRQIANIDIEVVPDGRNWKIVKITPKEPGGKP